MKGKILTFGIGTAVAVTSLSSCNESDVIIEDGAMNENMASNEATAISMKNLSENEQTYIHDMSLLSYAILNDMQVAESFLKDPLTCAQSLGIKTNIDINDGSVRFLLAICKPEFREAINKRDIRRFVTLCEENEVFKNAVSSNIDLFKNDDILNNPQKVQAAMGFFWIGEWILLGVAYVGVGIEYAAIGDTIISAVTNNTINSEIALQLWDVETQDGSVYDLADEYKNQYIQDIVDLIKEKHPEVIEQYGDKELMGIIQRRIRM